jgi:uncharacterized protein GlcG (DUF336 family)
MDTTLTRMFTPLAAALVLAATAAPAAAQGQLAPPPQTPYGLPISLEDAKKVAAAAVVEANRITTPMTIAIVDPAGYLVYFERLPNNQLASVQIAIDKARSAALYRRPTKLFQDALATGAENLRILTLADVLPSDGGVPLIVEGRIVGAIGISGGTSAQDGQVASAAARGLGVQ